MRAILAIAPDMDEQALVGAAPGSGIQVLRRCVDVIDLRAAAELEPHVPVVVSLGFPRLTADHVHALGSSGRTIIGLIAHDQHATALAALGIQRWVSAQGTAETTMRLVADALLGHATDGVWHVEQQAERLGRVIGVCGAHGAPGRTHLALELARALPAASTCLIDFDLVAPSVTMRLGVIDEVSGVMVAVRHLEHGSLRPSTMASAAQTTHAGFALLSGLRERSFRAQLGEHHRDAVLECAAQTFQRVVVDVGPDVLVGDDQIIVVRPDVVGVMRTLELLDDMGQPGSDPIIAVNGRKRDVVRVRAAFADHGFDLPTTVARARDVLRLLRGRQGEGKTMTRSPILAHS